MIRLSIRRPVAISMAYLTIALLGVAAWRNLPIELLPDTALPRLYVTASWRGASPETTEALLTSPLEGAIQQVRGVSKITSESFEQNGRGQARISVEFARGTDMDFARLDLSERLAALESKLPRGATRPAISGYVPRELQDQKKPFLQYTVTGPYTLEALRAHVDDAIAPELTQLDGVANVIASGGRGRVLEIELDEDKVRALRLNLVQVQQRVAELEYVRQAGLVDRGGRLHTLAIRQRAESADEIARLPLLTDQGRVVRVADVARIHDTFEEPLSYYRIDGQPAVSFTVYREAGSNAVAVADRVKAKVDALRSSTPAGVRLLLDDDESKSIRAQLTDLRFRALVSAGVVFLILLLFLGSIRSAGIVFLTIAFSILITLNLIYFGGYTLNVLTLMGIAMGFGLIVDNAIVVLENIYRLRGEGVPVVEAAERGSKEVVLAVLASTLTTVVVLVPFVYLQGEMRDFYVPLAIVVGFSLLASLIVAFTFIPALAVRILGGGDEATAGEIQSVTLAQAGIHASGVTAPPAARKRPFYVRLYAGAIGGTLRFPWVTVVVALAALGGSYYLFDKYVTRGIVWGRWGGEDTYIDITITLPRGDELERTDELAHFFEARLAAMPEVERFVTNVYPQRAAIRVTFPDSLRLTSVPVAIKEQMVAFSHQFGGAEVRVYGFGPSFYGGGGSAPNYSIKVLGYNYEQVRQIAEDLAERLKRFSRIRDVDPNASGGWFERDKATEFVLNVDRRRLALHDLTMQQLVAQVNAAVQGEARGVPIHLGGDEVQLAIKLSGNRNLDLLGLQDLLIPTPRGQAVRLADVARLEERQVMSRIVRENQQYQRNVSYEFRGPAKLGDKTHEAVMKATQLPPGYKLEGRQDWKWSTEEKGQIYGMLAFSVVLIFMVTAALFESIRLPLCVLLTVPMALIGIFLTFFYANATFTREAYIGVIMMGGVVVNNAILLVDHVNQRRRRDGMALEEAIVQGTIERVRPILMTSACTILGLLPLVIFSESADANIWNALGYAMMGGMTSSTVLVLTVTPALYLIFERRAERRRLAREAMVAPLGEAYVLASGD
jgi:HAE1 family hydrophobic/amphiphilic exporter-1